MPDIFIPIKAEIIRLSRKEAKKAVDPIRKITATHRRDIAELKRQLTAATRQLSVLQRRLTKRQSPLPEKTERPIRFVAKGLRSRRARLGLSAVQLGKLLGVSEQSVYQWEQKKAVLRPHTVQAIAGLRAIGRGF